MAGAEVIYKSSGSCLVWGLERLALLGAGTAWSLMWGTMLYPNVVSPQGLCSMVAAGEQGFLRGGQGTQSRFPKRESARWKPYHLL